MTATSTAIHRRVWQRLATRRPRGAEAAILDRHRIYILPTRQGLLFGALLVVMLLGAINYSNNLAFVLTFVLGSQAVVSILYTYRNLAGLRLRAGHHGEVFAGGSARLAVVLESDASPRPDVTVAWRRAGEGVRVDVPGRGAVETRLELPAPRRGWLRPGRFVVATAYPLGLFRAWSWVELDLRVLVYPRPIAGPASGAGGVDSPGGTEGAAVDGHEDFANLRAFRTGDSPRHVAWKAVARGQPLHTKQFEDRAEETLWLDYEALAGLDGEARLSRLAARVTELAAAGATWGLRLPGCQLGPDRGAVHRRSCLEALALFGADS